MKPRHTSRDELSQIALFCVLRPLVAVFARRLYPAKYYQRLQFFRMGANSLIKSASAVHAPSDWGLGLVGKR